MKQVLTQRLSVVQLDRQTFLLRYFFPAVARLPAASRDTVFLGLLSDLQDLKRSYPEVVEQLQQVCYAALAREERTAASGFIVMWQSPFLGRQPLGLIMVSNRLRKDCP